MSGYWAALAWLALARGLDLGSTWLASPDLRLEGNPLVRRLGWRRTILINVAACFALAGWDGFPFIVSAGLMFGMGNCVVAMHRRREPLAAIGLVACVALMGALCVRGPVRWVAGGMVAFGLIWTAWHMANGRLPSRR